MSTDPESRDNYGPYLPNVGSICPKTKKQIPYNDVFPRFAEFVTKFFDFDMVLPMNTGAEAVETAVKIARKWGYKVKKIPQNEAIVLGVAENFHGRTVCVRA